MKKMLKKVVATVKRVRAKIQNKLVALLKKVGLRKKSQGAAVVVTITPEDIREARETKQAEILIATGQAVHPSKRQQRRRSKTLRKRNRNKGSKKC